MKIWCHLAHKRSWSLYGGFQPKGFIHCNECGAIHGDRSEHSTENSPATPYTEASVSLRMAAEKKATASE
jgi:hypothetical protein